MSDAPRDAQRDAQITGAVAIGHRVYLAGDEAAFRDALASEAAKDVDLARLEAVGVLRGFGRAAAPAAESRAESDAPKADAPKAHAPHAPHAAKAAKGRK